MASITYWNRLVPQPLGTALDTSLRAELRDPAWTLARQLQLGEFLAVDGGSPAFVDVATRMKPVAGANDPLEPVMETEPVAPDLALRIELGQALEALIDRQVTPAASATAAKAALRTRYALPASSDPAAGALLAACAGRVADGVTLQADLARDNAPSIDAATDAALKPVFTAFLAWVRDVVGEIGTTPPPDWNAPQLTYSITLATTLPDGRSATLAGEPDRSMNLEWYAFDLATAGSTPTPTAPQTRSVLPIHVRFRGMPNDRFWDFESNKTEYGNVVVDVPDAGRLLFLDFMLIHGAGWYIVPFDISVGSLCQIDSLTVHSVFGDASAIPRADANLGPAGARWTLFSTSDRTTGGVANFLFAAPTCAAAAQQSVAIEDVRLFRDDAAGLAWAVEEVAPDAAGNPAQGYERGQAPAAPPALPILRYQLQTGVPPAWFALLPQASGGSLIDFALEPIAGGSPQPFGRIIPSLAATAVDGSASGVPEQVVPRSGLRLQRIYCRSRWIDGSTYVWLARRRLLGARGPLSGLVYDSALPPTS
jgi:hypothetical protein